jgi:hypothetical protein
MALHLALIYGCILGLLLLGIVMACLTFGEKYLVLL